MKYIKVGATALNQTPLDWLANKNNIVAAIDTARVDNVSILCLPELCISGYGCEDAFLAPGTLTQSLNILHDIAKYSSNIIVAVGLPLLYQNRVYNTVCLLIDGKIAGFVAKRFLPNDGIHYESRWFHSWAIGVDAEIEINRHIYPIGDIHFNCGGVRIGFEICEEAWVANRPGIKLAEQGVDIILNPSASHFAFHKHRVRERFVLEGSRSFSVSYIYTNLLGNEAGRVIYDGDAMIASNNKILASSSRFSFDNYQSISAFVDVDLTRMAQARTSQGSDNINNCINIAFEYPVISPCQKIVTAASELSKEEEFSRAVSLGLFDYLRKSRAQGFVVSLSGGADSSAIACLVYLMVKLAVAELGIKGFREKLNHINLPTTTITDIIKSLLTCVYQATENSSEITQNAANTLATSLGADYLNLNINNIYIDYVELISEALNKKLSWETDDLALQNIQARVRSPSVWLIANIRNALLLATSNRSEVALGYATMDGDTSGGLSPLAGIDKDFLRHWLRWLEKSIPALKLINEQSPTAELRPAAMTQTDEADLMPYSVLNRIEQAAIRDRQTPSEIFCLLRQEYDEQQLITWIERFFTLWSRNQWKRERFAPCFHLDDENLDPKTWCRFPILSGGYKKELEEMRERFIT
jgi:NAD+ synthase (glutamine-hydrolysing)